MVVASAVDVVGCWAKVIGARQKSMVLAPVVADVGL